MRPWRDLGIHDRLSGPARKAVQAFLALLWLFVTSTQGYTPEGKPHGAFEPPRQRKSPELSQTTGPCFETGSQALSEVFYLVGAQLSLQGWDVEVVPYSCAIRTAPRAGESVWYRVSGENLVATRKDTVRAVVAIPADEICRSPLAKRPAVPPEEMILYVAEACSSEGLDGVALALVSGSWQGGAGFESLRSRMNWGACLTILLEPSSSEGRGNTALSQVLPRPQFSALSSVWRYPDQDAEAARRSAGLLARHIRRTLARLWRETGGNVVVLDAGPLTLTVSTTFLQGFCLSVVGIALLILVISPKGRTCLADIRGFFDLASFICLSLPALLLPAIYRRLIADPLSESTRTRLALTTALLLTFGWRLAAWLCCRRDRRALRGGSSGPGSGPGPADLRPFACFFLGGLAAGSAATLPASRPGHGPVLGYILIMTMFLCCFFFSGTRARTTRIADAAIASFFALTVILDPSIRRNGFALSSYVENLSLLEREAFGPPLTASVIAAEFARTARLTGGRHARRPPEWRLALGLVLPLVLCPVVWAAPSPDDRAAILRERVALSVPPDLRSSALREASAPGSDAAGYLSPPSEEQRWADLELSCLVDGDVKDASRLEITLQARFREPPALLKVTLRDLSSPWSMGNAGEIVIDGSDFLGVSAEVHDTLGGSTRQVSFVRWRPHERDMVSRFVLHANPRSRVRVSVEAIYTGKTCFTPIAKSESGDVPVLVMSSWETWLEIP